MPQKATRPGSICTIYYPRLLLGAFYVLGLLTRPGSICTIYYPRLLWGAFYVLGLLWVCLLHIVLLCLPSLSCSGCCQHLSTDLARKTPIRKRVASRVDYLHKDHIKDSVCIINETINQSAQHSVRNKMLKSDLRLLWLTFDRPKSVSLICPVFDSSMLSGFKSLFHQNNTNTHTYAPSQQRMLQVDGHSSKHSPCPPIF